MVSVLGGATLSFDSTSIALPLLFGSTVVKSALALVFLRLNILIESVRTLCVPLWLITWVTSVLVQSLPTSVNVNWTADVVALAAMFAIVDTSGTNPDGGAIVVDTFQSPSATNTNGYTAVSSVQSTSAGDRMSSSVPSSTIFLAATTPPPYGAI